MREKDESVSNRLFIIRERERERERKKERNIITTDLTEQKLKGINHRVKIIISCERPSEEKTTTKMSGRKRGVVTIMGVAKLTQVTPSKFTC